MTLLADARNVLASDLCVCQAFVSECLIFLLIWARSFTVR